MEINTSFYQAIQPELASLWVKKVEHNPKFQFTVKLGRRFTHERSLAPGGDRALQGRAVAVSSRAQTGLRADAISLDLPLHRREPRIPDRAAARLP